MIILPQTNIISLITKSITKLLIKNFIKKENRLAKSTIANKYTKKIGLLIFILFVTLF